MKYKLQPQIECYDGGTSQTDNTLFSPLYDTEHEETWIQSKINVRLFEVPLSSIEGGNKT